MLSKNKIKFIKSLAFKKYRDAENCFLAEGPKVVGDLLGKLPCRLLAATSDFLESQEILLVDEVAVITQRELEQASLLKSPRDVLAVFERPQCKESVFASSDETLSLALDDVQDPGNLGTIVRLADWFGITRIYASKNTADVFSPKAVQATMGALARVQVQYVDLPDVLAALSKETPIYGTFLEGENIYGCSLGKGGVLVMGNEGNGISTVVERMISHKLYIPNYPLGRATSESLNVAVATAIACAEFRRQQNLV